MTTLPTLYKSTKTGKTQVCIISYESSQFTVEFGQLEGKRQTKSTECYPTNVGRANERNATAQAEFEAHAKWQKKVDTGYRVELPSEVAVDTDVVQLPQKVKVYQDQLRNVDDFVYLSDKLDGLNATYRLIDGKLVLYSRGGKVLPPIPHIEKDLLPLMKHYNMYELNGELYIPDTHLQLISSAVRATKPLSSQLQFHIFEYPLHTATYTERLDKLQSIDQSYLTPYIHVISSVLRPKATIERYYNYAMSRGAEGLIIRNPTGHYKHNERSSDVFKYKKMLQSEFLITDYILDKDGNPTLICNSDGGQFKVRPRGDRESRADMLANIGDYIGEWYTVDFESWTLAGKPSKPIGVGLRKCDPEGEPLE